ncbi:MULTISPECIES: LrgB family protein [Cohnella]|uniref:LrgB family protein n=1 Tax=Cohnella TaxID=329857 RepID=UPI0009BBDBCC|nr:MULTISPECIES: LrgB family protein [Cohnella]MBN2983069.1 LrgB family protein [Cohnella algarum]
MRPEWLGQPLFGVALSVVFYSLSLIAGKRFAWLHPLFVSSGGIILFLVLTDIPYEVYEAGGEIVTFFLGPATVALGVPLYKYRKRIRAEWVAVLGGITAGALVSIVSTGGLLWALGASRETILSAMPKSVSSPIALELARLTGGSPELSATLTVLTGLAGSMMGISLLRLLRIRGDLPIGVAIGTAAHGIGTSRLLRQSEAQGSYSGFAMAMNGIVTGLLYIPIVWWLDRV